MRRPLNIIGPAIARLRYQRGWRQEDLVAKMQIVGCYMTRDILANIETRRSPVSDAQVIFFCVVFKVRVQDLYPPHSEEGGYPVKVADPEAAFRIVTRRRPARKK